MKPRAIRLFGLTLSLLALLFLLGGHWFLLQSIAWTRMLADFARTESIEVAWKKTFDGQHACRMCLSIREGRAQEEQSQQSQLLMELRWPDLWLERRAALVPDPPATAIDQPGFVPQLHTDFIAIPPTPPPRAS